VRAHQQTVDRATQMSACDVGGLGFESRHSGQFARRKVSGFEGLVRRLCLPPWEPPELYSKPCDLGRSE
jgi:hypothetical protein